MLDFPCKSSSLVLGQCLGPRLLVQLNCNENGWVSTTATPHLRFKSLSSAATSNSQSLASSVENLVSSLLGLSPESFLKIPKKQIHLKSESVLALFRDYGFSPSDIAKIFSVYPVLLSLHPQKTLKPKLDSFAEIGISGDTLVDIVTKDASVLTRSLEGRIIPCVNFLKAFFNGNTQSIISLLSSKRGSWIFSKLSENTPLNVEALRAYGVSDFYIAKFWLTGCSWCLTLDPEQYNQLLREVKEMGFDPSSPMFAYAIRAVLRMKKDKWVSKMEVFKKSYGWNDQQVRALIVKQPQVMTLSKKKLKEALEFFTNTLGLTAHDIAKYPSLLGCSIDRRILPRFSVLEILMSKGLVKKTSMGRAFQVSEDVFLRKFVREYEDYIPQLLQIYQRKKNGC